MHKLGLFLMISIFLVSCGGNKEDKKVKKGVFINELVFETFDNNKLDFVEIYNSTKDSVSFVNAVLKIDDHEFPLEELGGVKSDGFVLYKIKGRVQNKSFKASLTIDNELKDEFEWKAEKQNEFIGRKPNGSILYSLGSRSLGKTNNHCKAKLEKPKFNLTSGFYKDQQKVELVNPRPGAKLVYTIDGSKPNKKSKKYNGPIEVNSSTVLKARFIGKKVKSKVKTLSLLFNENSKLPVVSLIVDSLKMWDEQKGMLMRGPGAEKKFPYKGANFWKKTTLNGRIHVFSSDKKLILDKNAGVKIHGNYSRGIELKGLRIKGGNKYFEFDAFDKGVELLSEFTLRAAGQDMGQGHFRDAFAHNYLGQTMDLDVQRAAPVLVLINGRFYGVMHIREVYNKDYFKAHHGCSTEAAMLKLWGVPMWGNQSDEGYGELKSILNNKKTSAAERAREVVSYYDYSNWMDYYIAETYSGNKDWFPNNAKFWKSNVTGKWRYVLNDLDAGFGRPSDDHYKINLFEFLKNKSPNKEFKIFMQNESLKQQFLMRYMDLLNTTLSTDLITKNAKKHQAIIEKDMNRLFDKYRWEKSMKKWKEYELPKLYKFYKKRPEIIRSQLKDYFGLEEAFTVNVDTKGAFKLNSLYVKGKVKVKYFPSQKIRISVDQFKSSFSHFELNGKVFKGSSILITGKPGEKINLKVVFK